MWLKSLKKREVRTSILARSVCKMSKKMTSFLKMNYAKINALFRRFDIFSPWGIQKGSGFIFIHKYMLVFLYINEREDDVYTYFNFRSTSFYINGKG